MELQAKVEGSMTCELKFSVREGRGEEGARAWCAGEGGCTDEGERVHGRGREGARRREGAHGREGGCTEEGV